MPRRPKRLLIVSPRFPPVESPEVHRARTMLNHLRENGWEGSVLTLDLPASGGDSRLAQTYPESTEIRRSRCLPAIPGAGSLGWRSRPFLEKKGTAWIQENRFDLIYFTTTVNEVFRLGPIWKRKHGIPYVLDYQDPWLTDYYDQPDAPEPPGGRMKYRIHQWLARRSEPRCVRTAAGITAVSEDYLHQLRSRYPEARGIPMRTAPFGVAETDWNKSKELGRKPWKTEKEKIWLNLGRLAPSMKKALEAFLESLAIRPPSAGTKILFLGTSYQEGVVSEVDPVGMAKKICPQVDVEAVPGRLPLLDALKALQQADRLLFFGSDDPGYMPSRLFQYLQAGKPLLAVLHEKSPAYRFAQQHRMPGLAGFATQEGNNEVALKITKLDWKTPVAPEAIVYTAADMTRDLCGLFEEAMAASPKAATSKNHSFFAN